MKTTFRASMAWLHTWTGLIVGWVLYFVFVTGTIGFFYVELDRWMRPELPLVRTKLSQIEAATIADGYLRGHAAMAEAWSIGLPTDRDPQLNLSWIDTATSSPRKRQRRLFDAWSGQFVESRPRSTGGAYLLYRMHWQLHYLPSTLGIKLIGACTMIMFVALISGVITHRLIFKDFFTFRPGTRARTWLDAHTTASVLALPFFVMMTYSGLVFFFSSYMPGPLLTLYGNDDARFFAEIDPRYGLQHGDVSQPTLPLASLLSSATKEWGHDAHWSQIEVLSPGRANAEVRFTHASNGTLMRAGREQLHYSGVDGRLIRRVTAATSTGRMLYSGLLGMHEAVFAGPVLRWLYFLLGLLGCVMVATGLVLWTVKRVARHDMAAGKSHSVVERLNVGTVAGLPVAIAAYFGANRLLAPDLPWRAAWEVNVMFATWTACLVYPMMRTPIHAWRDELAIGAAIFTSLPILNAITTERHLGVTLPAGDWALAGVDLTMLATGVVFATGAGLLSRRLRRGQAANDTVR